MEGLMFLVMIAISFAAAGLAAFAFGNDSRDADPRQGVRSTFFG